jgi:hypothetical protein
MTEACQNSPVNSVERQVARLHFIFHTDFSQFDLMDTISHRFLWISFPFTNRRKLSDDFAKFEPLGVEKLDHVSLLDFRDVAEKCETDATEQMTLAADEHVLPHATSYLSQISSSHLVLWHFSKFEIRQATGRWPT